MPKSACVRGKRTPSEAMLLARRKGRHQISDAGRQALSEAGRRAVIRGRKFWTKPEREFWNILGEMGLGVKFPEYVKETCDVDDDPIPTICYQYPLQRYVCDFVDVGNKVVYRVQGDFWHANPLLYDEDKLTEIQKHNVRQDKNARIFLEKHGWIVCDIWESEIYWNKEVVKGKIGPLSQLASEPALQAGGSEFESREDHSDWSEKLKSLWFKSKPRRHLESKVCSVCQCMFQPRQDRRKFCSLECASKSHRRVPRPTKEELAELLWKKPTQQIAKGLGVTDNAVKKWAKSYGITEYPPRGWWQKQGKNDG